MQTDQGLVEKHAWTWLVSAGLRAIRRVLLRLWYVRWLLLPTATDTDSLRSLGVLILLKLTDLSKVRKEISPHDMMLENKKRGDDGNKNKNKITYLVNIRANYLTHLNVVFRKQAAIVSASAPHLI